MMPQSIDGGAPRPIKVTAGGWNSDQQSPQIPSADVKDCAIYERSITIPAEAKGQVVKILFGGCNYGAEVFLDDQKITEHHAPMTPFEADVTAVAKPGQTQRLKVKSYTRYHYGKLPQIPVGFDFNKGMSRIKWPFEGDTKFAYGLTGYVRLALYPAVYLKEVFVRPSVSEKSLAYDVWIANGSATEREVVLKGGLSSWDKRTWSYPALPDRSVLALYSPGEGVWNTLHNDGQRVELRHCVDYIYIGNALVDDLTPTMRSEMTQFVQRELLMPTWMRAMSVMDAAAAKSDRPDHGPMGAYDGWPALTVATMWRLGFASDAFDFYCKTAAVTKEGPFAQAREFYGPRKAERDAPVRVALRGGCMKECVSGVAFSDVVISTFFGFTPSLDGKTLVADPKTPRPFQGTLTGVRWGNQLYQLTAGQSGVQIQMQEPRKE